MKKKEVLLVECLEVLKKDELMRLGDSISLKLQNKFTKEEMRCQISSFVINNPEKFLSKLSRGYLLHMQAILKDDGKGIVCNSINPVQGVFFDFGLTYSIAVKKVYYERFPKEVEKVLSPFIDQYVAESCNKSNERYDKETLLLGLVNVYGIISLKNILIVCKKHGVVMTETELIQFMNESMLLKLAYNKSKGVFISELIVDLDYLPRAIEDAQFPIDISHSKADIMPLGNSICPIPITKESEKLKKFLMKSGITDDYANQILSKLWISINNFREDESLKCVFYCIESALNVKLKFEQYKILVLNYFHVSPLWLLKGNTEERILYFAKRASESPQAAIMETIQNTMANFTPGDSDGVWEELNSLVTKKVGRNDPCPCGSGKKFKTCCGSN